MPRRLLVSLILGFIMWPLGSHATSRCEHLVAIGVGNHAPYQWLDPDRSQPQGASVVLLQRLAQELGLTMEILTADNLEQAEREVISGRVDLLINARPRPELLAELDFLQPPLHRAPVVVWVVKGRAFPLQGWEDLQGRRGVRIDTAGGDVEVEGLRLASHSDFAQALQDLLEGKSDYVLFDHSVGLVQVLRKGWGDRVEVLMPALYSRPRFLALSNNSVCITPELKAELAKALQRLESEGSASTIIAHHIQ